MNGSPQWAHCACVCVSMFKASERVCAYRQYIAPSNNSSLPKSPSHTFIRFWCSPSWPYTTQKHGGWECVLPHKYENTKLYFILFSFFFVRSFVSFVSFRMCRITFQFEPSDVANIFNSEANGSWLNERAERWQWWRQQQQQQHQRRRRRQQQ